MGGGNKNTPMERLLRSWYWLRIFLSIQKLLLALIIIAGIVDIIRRGYGLFTEQTGSIQGAIIFVVEICFCLLAIYISRRRKYRFIQPKFKIVLASLLLICLAFTFSGVQPLSGYKDNLIEGYHKWVVEREEEKILVADKVEIPAISVNEKTQPVIPIEVFEYAELSNIDAGDYEVIFNQYRESYSRVPLVFTDDLNHIANLRLAEIKIDFSHRSQHNRYLAENIAVGVSNDQEALHCWAESPLHNFNMLDVAFNNTGYAAGGGYAVQVFSKWDTINGNPQLPPGWYFDE